MELTVVGPVTRDVTVLVDRLPADGGSEQARAARVAAGGKGGSAAVAAALLGARVRLLGAVGEDEAGAWALAELAAAGVDVAGVQRHPGLTGHVLHLVEPEGRRRYVEVAGANAALEPPAEVVGGGTLLVSTAVPRSAAEAAVRAGRDGGARVAVDVAGDVETARAALPFADVVRGDADEIEALLGHAVTGFGSAAAAARRLLAVGVEIAVVQAGSAGDVVVRGEEEIRLPRLDVPVVDPTGGGDALIATLLVLLARGRPLPEAARLASAAAAHTVARLGGRPTFRGEEDLAALLASRASPA